MKKLFFSMLTFLTCMAAVKTIETSPNCWDYTGRWLRRTRMEPVECNCNCEQQYRFRHDDKKGYRCWKCEHKLIPTNPLEIDEMSKLLN